MFLAAMFTAVATPSGTTDKQTAYSFVGLMASQKHLINEI
jgi:hypothetical protein